MSRNPSSAVCGVKARRLRLGWSQEELAQKVQLRRQAVYDMETGRYLPNTAVALRLAELFGCTVEELFGEAAQRAARLSGPAAAPDRVLLLMGCDPALELLEAAIRRATPSARVRCQFASSGRALAALAGGGAHTAAIHFHSHGEAEANVTAAEKALPGTPCRVLGFSLMEEGLMVAQGNPLGIRSAADLARPGLRFANREPGAALRALLETLLAAEGVPGLENQGPDVYSHSEGACRVALGSADAALGLRATAEAFGLAFVPLAVTRSDLVLPLALESLPAMAALLDTLQSARLRRDLAGLPGCDGGSAGTLIARL